MKLRSRVVTIALTGLLACAGCDLTRMNQPKWNRGGEIDAIRKALRSPANVARQEGLAAAILLDTSGSMSDSVRAAKGGAKPKIEIAREAAISLVQQFSEFALKHPDRPILVGVYEFSGRTGRPSCRRVVSLGRPDLPAARQSIEGMEADGSTPIGDAMILAKQDLEASGMSRQHILVVSDGESNRGFTPGDVTSVISGLPESDRAAIYFIAFDVEAEIFNPVKEAGALVLAASSEQDLRQTLDYILTGKILVEQPAVKE